MASISILLTGGSSVTVTEARPSSPTLGMMIQAPTVAVTTAAAAPSYMPGAEHPVTTAPPPHRHATVLATVQPPPVTHEASQTAATTPAPTPPEHTPSAVPSSSSSHTAAPSPPSGSLGARLLAEAETQEGVPYVWAGDSPGGFDCSGLIYWAAMQIGVSNMPRDTYDMLGQGVNSGLLVPVSDPEPGDLAFFGTGHVELYVSPGKYFGAQQTGTLVGFHDYGTGYLATAFYRVT